MSSSFPVMKEAAVAEKLQISIYTLIKLRKEGKGPPHIMLGRQIRYVEEVVDDWLKENSTQEEDK